MFTEEKARGEFKELDETTTLLLKAAALIEERGHCKHQTVDRDGRLCLWGGILVAAGGNPSSVVPCGLAWKAIYKIDAVIPGECAIIWNDRPERTGEEVITKLRAVALGLS
jgi:hypothetical protein